MDMITLTNALSSQLQMFEELLAILTRETEELSEINLKAMSEINGQKEEVTSRIEAHTAPLRRAIGEMASSQGLTADASLGDLVAKLKKKGNKEIPRLHQDLFKIVAKIRQTADLNREIAERFVSTVNTSLNFLTRIINQSNIYGASGGYQRRPAGAVMINREA